jgi:hypothetical protein
MAIPSTRWTAGRSARVDKTIGFSLRSLQQNRSVTTHREGLLNCD